MKESDGRSGLHTVPGAFRKSLASGELLQNLQQLANFYSRLTSNFCLKITPSDRAMTR